MKGDPPRFATPEPAGGGGRHGSLPWALGLALLLLLVASTGVLAGLAQIRAGTRLVKHTYDVIETSDAVLAALTKAETGQRGFLLTGDAAYLAPFAAARRPVDLLLDRLRAGTRRDPEAAASLGPIRALASAKMTELARTVARASDGDRAGALAIVHTNVGATLMTELRARLTALDERERARLRDRSSALAAWQGVSEVVALVALIGSFGAALAAAFLLLRRSRRAEQALADIHAELAARVAQLQAIYDTAPVGLAFCDAARRYRAINERLADMHGVAVGDHLGRTVDEVTQNLAGVSAPFYGRALAGEIIRDADLRAPSRADAGGMRDYLASYWPVRDEAGAIAGVHAAVLDITERRSAERGLLLLAGRLESDVAARTAELRGANEQLDAFVYTVSHDLRAPLRAMEGFTRILLDDFAPELGDAGRRYAQRIVAAAERMESLIDDLLSYSRLQRVDVMAVEVEPALLARNCADTVLASLPPGVAGIAVSPGIPRVIADPVVLRQVLCNLLDNAAKFRRPGEPAQVRVDGHRSEGRVRIEVTDDGIGIAQAHQHRIFNVFERLHGQETYSGTGIGLAIVRTGVVRMGGQYGVTSEEGAGSTFWLELPAA